MLLTHYSGLPADLDLKEAWNGTDEGYSRANAAKLINAPGSTFLYSDVGFVVLGELVQKVGGMPLDQYAQTYVFGPLGMASTRFNPPTSWGPRIAPTQRDEHTGQMVRGTVHDPTAHQMGGVAGDAGLFSTADDVAKFAQALLNGGAPILSPLIVEKMTTPQQPSNMPNVRGLGWDIDSPFSSTRGELLPVGSFGHTGFTGTSLWIDPTTNTYVILLTNSTVLKDGNVIGLRSEIATAVAAALQLTPTQEQKMRVARITGYNETQMAERRIVVRNGKVLTGIDALEERQFEPLKVPNVPTPHIGLLTNQTGIDSRGKRTIDVLARAVGMQLAAIFTPEYDMQSTTDSGDAANAKDGATGVPIYSVYGDTDAKRRPPLDVVRKLDVLVVDLQDVGARFSSYESTLGYFLEAAAKAKKPIVVLDRPNPLTGAYVQGPLSDAGQESFVNYYPLPVRHGMTIGELAKLFNEEKHIDADLTVVPMRGWLRGDWFDYRRRVDEPHAHHSQPRPGYVVSGRRSHRGHQRFGRSRHRHAVPTRGLALLHRQRTCQLSEWPQHSRSAFRAHVFHSNLRTVCSPRVLSGLHHRDQSRGAGRAGVGTGAGSGAAQAFAVGIRLEPHESATGE